MASKKPPTTEIGVVSNHGPDTSGLIPWASIIDEYEENRDLAFPASTKTYRTMRSTDAHISAILSGITIPIRRFGWGITPNGARDEVVEFIARQLNLPIVGAEDETKPRSRNRFNHDRHLNSVVRNSLTYGWQMHEQVYEIDKDTKAYLLRKLAQRPQHTITEILTAPDGGLDSIKQGWGFDAPQIGVERLVAYVWEQEAGSWTGESLLRSMYRPWKIKDRILRVGAINIERAGGVPYVEAAQGANAKELRKAREFAQQFRIGESAGGALPYGWQLKFAQAAGGSEAADYVKLQNQEMSRRALAMFLDLGTTETGARALGEGFIDFFSLQLDTIAGWYSDTTNDHVIADLVDVNYGPDEQAPLLTYTRNPNPELATDALVQLVNAGLIVVDNQLEDMIRGRYKLTPAEREQLSVDTGVKVDVDNVAKAVEAGLVRADASLEAQIRGELGLVDPDEAEAPAGQSYGYDLDNGILTIDERRAQVGLGPKEDGTGVLTVPEYLAELEAAKGESVDTSTPQARELAAVEVLGSDFVAASKILDPIGDAVYAAKDPDGRVKLPSRNVRRLPNDVEIMAAVNFESLDDAWTSALDALISDWAVIRAAQIDELVAQITAADSLEDLGAIEIATAGAQELLDAMEDLVVNGIENAIAEAAAQGVTLSTPDVQAVEASIRDRALFIADTLTSELVTVATKAAARMGLDGEAVREELSESPVPAYVESTLRGVLTSAQNEGRFAVMGEAEDEAIRWVSSELLDANTCGECMVVDGTVYESLADALKDYPAGGYKRCEGRSRCRGTIVAVYKEGVAAARKRDVSKQARSVGKEVGGQFGYLNLGRGKNQERAKQSKARVGTGRLSADEKIENYRKMFGKDPSPAQVKKLRADEAREAKKDAKKPAAKKPAVKKTGSNFSGMSDRELEDFIATNEQQKRKARKAKLGDLYQQLRRDGKAAQEELDGRSSSGGELAREAQDHLDDLISDKRFVARKENRYIDDKTRALLLENVIPELQVLQQKLEAAKSDDDAKRIINDREAALRRVMSGEFIDDDGREGVNLALGEIGDLKLALDISDDAGDAPRFSLPPKNEKGEFEELPKIDPNPADPGPIEAMGGKPNRKYNEARLKAIDYDDTFPPDPEPSTIESILSPEYEGENGYETRNAFGVKDGKGWKYTEERAQLHEQIIEHYLAGKVPPEGRKPVATYMSGGGGAGKGTALKGFKGTPQGDLIEGSVHIDPDEIKKLLPEFRQMVEAGDGAAAAVAHEESSDIAKELTRRARALGLDTLVDGTLDGGDYSKHEKQFKAFVDAGFDIDIVMVTNPTETALERGISRAFGDGEQKQGSGRMVPPAMLRAAHKNASANHKQWATSKLVRSWQAFDTDVPFGDPAILLATGGGGKQPEVVDEAGYAALLAKADEVV